MKYDLLYGRGMRSVTVPDDANVTVVRKPEMPRLPDPQAAVHEALESGGLRKRGRDARTACIAICDITRPVPNHLFLKPVVDELIAAGMALDAITVLVATGLHRPNLGKELEELIGDSWVLDHVRIVNHDARDDDEHVDLGRTSTRGTVVKIDRRFVDADLRIATGLVEPHFMAGYSGGRKVIAPGLAHADTIRTFHNAKFMGDPAAANCNLDQNPLHEEQLQIVEMIGGAHAINTVIDEDRNLSLINFGEIISSHSAAVEFVSGFCRVQVPGRFETVVTSAAGHPLDKTYYQTVKGMVGAIDILQPGGNLIVLSECGEGVGSPEFAAAQQRLVRQGVDDFLASITRQPLAAIDEWQTQMQTKAMAAGTIHLHSSLSRQETIANGVRHVDDVDATIAACVAGSPGRSIAVIPEGPYVIPYSSE
ncbi:MAG: nickel-dependent lactate racemase [Planctomycetota bacterium]